MRDIVLLGVIYAHSRMTRSFVLLGMSLLSLNTYVYLICSSNRTVRECHCSVLASLLVLNYNADRNIGNARIAGLEKDLKMTDHQFSTALTVT